MVGDVVAGKDKYRYGKVVELIREMIRRGEFRVGERLPAERVLAERFHVSRNSIRQAIQTLSDRKVLESRRGAGTYVCAADESALIDSFGAAIRAQRDLIREILDFRLLIEPQVALLAAENITPGELDRLKIIVCDQERRILAGKEDRELDSAFHLGLAAASKNRIVMQVMDKIDEILNVSRSEALWNETRRKASIIGHLRIIDALENKDSAMACEAMREHLFSVEQILFGEKEDGRLKVED
jgi:GntR family transcriptional repressor for pyruvate dehydrogenase complex